MIQLILLALAPAAAIIHFFYWRDKYEKEPFLLLFYAFMLGVFSIVPALFGGTVGSYFGIEISENVITTIIYAFFIVALFEEVAKYIFLRYFMFKRKEFDEPYDGIMYAVMVGMGFATFENIMYVMQGGVGLAIARMFTAVPAHGAFGAVMGYYVGLAKFDAQNRPALLLKGLLGAVVLHGSYDFFLMQQESEGLMLMALPILAVSVYYARRAIVKHQKNSPFNPSNRMAANNIDQQQQQQQNDIDHSPQMPPPLLADEQKQITEPKPHLSDTSTPASNVRNHDAAKNIDDPIG